MKVVVAVLGTAIVSIAATVFVIRRTTVRESKFRPQSASTPIKASQAWLNLKKSSAELDAKLSDAVKVDARNSEEASTTLKAYRSYCQAEMDLFSKEESLYRDEHGAEDSPILIEQKEATAAWCDRVDTLNSFIADPKNGYQVEGDAISVVDAATYKRLMLAFRVASVRLVNANAAEASQESEGRAAGSE